MELEFVEWLRGRVASPEVVVGIGDDAAVLRGSSLHVLCSDMLLDGVHFCLEDTFAELIGRKALAVNLSDVAAMGCRPLACTLSLALPRERAAELARRLVEGMLPLARQYSVALVGGDTNAWDGPLALDVTLLGTGQQPWLRSGAKPGDRLLLTGPLGGSLLGRHLRFEPRVTEAARLRELEVPVHAAIDISDGFALDLSRLCQASGVGAVVEAERLPVHPDAYRLAEQDRHQPLEHALYDGEDFELLLAVAPDTAADLLADQPLDQPLVDVGWIQDEPQLIMQQAGQARTLLPRGYVHGQ